MWNKITGSVNLIIQVIVVIAAVLIFSYLDPFGIFGSKKQTLQNTPVTVSSIREMGAFISAEYYGEVLSSLKDIQITEVNDNVRDLQKLDSSFSSAIEDMRKNAPHLRKKKKVEEYFHENYPEVANHPFYPYLLEYLADVYRPNKERKLLDVLYNNGYKPSLKTTLDFKKVFSKRSESLFAANKKELKRQLIMMGRGWVKAGFNFGKFTDNNFKYNSVAKIVYFIGLQPEILSCTINPWFIPEQKVRGFEIIAYNGKANNPKYVEEVKEKCLEELKQSALRQDILEKAQENAAESLRNFFSLLMDEPVREVVFVEDIFAYYQKAILDDRVFSDEEALLVDSVIYEVLRETRQRGETLDTVKLDTFMAEIRRVPYVVQGSRDSLERFTSLGCEIIRDYTVDSLEYTRLLRLRNDLNKTPGRYDSLWYRGARKGDLKVLKQMDYAHTIDMIGRHTTQVIRKGGKASKDPKVISDTLNLLKR